MQLTFSIVVKQPHGRPMWECLELLTNVKAGKQLVTANTLESLLQCARPQLSFCFLT